MKIFLFLLSFILGFILLKLEYIIASICLFIFILIVIIKQKIPVKSIFKYVLTTLASLTIFCTISAFSSSKDYINEGVFIVKRARENYVIVSNYFSNFYLYEKDNNFDEGDIIKISGNVVEFKSSTIESQYDFKEYLSTYCVTNRIYPNKIEFVINNPFSTKDFAHRYLDKYNEDAQFVISAINFGTKNYDSDLMSDYESLNIISLLSNSGVFFAFVLEGLILIFSVRLFEDKATIISLILCFPYLLFNLFSFGIFKVFFVKLLRLLFQKCKKLNKYGYFEALCLTSLVYLLFDPTVIFRLEFVLSFVLSFVNVSLLGEWSDESRTFKSNLLRSLKLKVFVFVFFIPINIYMNNSLNIFGLIAQIIFIPLFKIGYFMSFFSFLIGYNPILDGYYFALNKIISFISDYSISIYAPKPDTWMLGLFYIVLFIFVILIEKKIIPLQKMVVFTGIPALLIYFLPIKNAFSSEVTFINVGQGDCVLIRDRFTTCLIDTGGLVYLDVAKESVIPFLKSKRIYNIDTVFLTHDDFDHSGAHESLVKNFHVKFSVTEKLYFPYKIGNLEFQNFNIWSFEDKNENSLVLYLEIYGKKFLFMGDASKEVEYKILDQFVNLEVDYLKVGHHGSNTSTSEEFIAKLRPKEAIISCGKDNSFGHPHEETIKILEKYNVKIRRTDVEGTIVYNV